MIPADVIDIFWSLCGTVSLLALWKARPFLSDLKEFAHQIIEPLTKK